MLFQLMMERLETIAEELENRLIHSKIAGKTITLKIKYSDFTQQTRSKTVDTYLYKKEEFFPIIKDLLMQERLKNSVRLLGISLSNLNTEKKEPVWVQLRFEF